ncbi:MAG: acyl-CoA thioesterase [Caulobacterales bacterium]|jgi:acyl-CoA thioester hydrolase
MGQPQFTFEVTAEPQHIDALGHVNNTVYVAWAQDAGVRHWGARASLEMQARWVWVASRLEIDFLGETKLGESLTVETWVGEPRGARFDRFVRIVGPTGKARAQVRTTWALLDAHTRRPGRVTAEMIALFA